MPVTTLIAAVDRSNKVRKIVGLPLRDAANLSWNDVGGLLEGAETDLERA